MNLVRLLSRVAEETTPLRFLASRALRTTGVCRFLEIQRDGYRLKFSPTALATQLWHEPASMQKDETFLKKFLRPGDVCIDVGANIGTLTLVASQIVGPTGLVYSFEPFPPVYAYLLENLALNHVTNVRAWNCALGERGGTIRLNTSHSDDQNHVMPECDGQINLVRLDELPLPRKIALLKVDVEGQELAVLRGAAGILDRTDAIYFEAFEPLLTRAKTTFSELRDFLENCGFEVLSPEDQQRLPPNFVPKDCVNLLAVRGTAMVRSRLSE